MAEPALGEEAFRVLRKLLAGLIIPVAAVVTKVEKSIEDLLGDISSEPPEGWDEEAARKRDKQLRWG